MFHRPLYLHHLQVPIPRRNLRHLSLLVVSLDLRIGITRTREEDQFTALDNCSCNSGRKGRGENGTGFLRCRRFGRSHVGFGFTGEFRNLGVRVGRFSSRTGAIGTVTTITKAGKKVTRDGILAAVSTET